MLNAHQPGGNDLARVSFPAIGKDFIGAVRDEMYKENSLRLVPEVALTKLLTLRMRTSDGLRLELFGGVAFKDISDETPDFVKVQAATRNILTRKAKNHRWISVETMPQLWDVIEGVALAAKRLHHTTVLSWVQVIELGLMLKGAHFTHGGATSVKGLFRTFIYRLSEHAEAVRRAVNGDITELSPLIVLGQRSRVVFDDTIAAAKHHCMQTYKRENIDDGETVLGKALRKPEGIDANGKLEKYKRKTETVPLSGVRSRHPGGRDHTLARDAGEGHQEKKPRVQLLPCFRCNKHGHHFSKCVASDWCEIQASWPARIREIAKEARETAGAPVRYQKAMLRAPRQQKP